MAMDLLPEGRGFDSFTNKKRLRPLRKAPTVTPNCIFIR